MALDLEQIKARHAVVTVQTEGFGPIQPDEYYECNLCGGDGEVEGVILEAKSSIFAAGVGVYGIGKDLIALKDAVDNMPGDIAALLAEIDYLRAALEFYADESNYSTPRGNASPPPVVGLDGGRLARTALKAKPELPEVQKA